MALIAGVLAGGQIDDCFETIQVPSDDDWHIFATTATASYREMAARILTLPTHPGVAPRDIEVMVKTIQGDQGRAPEASR